MKGTVLLVDDSTTMRMILLRTLKLAGLEFRTVLEASGGDEALGLLRDNKVELIMCDVNMPGMSGLEFLQQMNEEGLAAGVPVVVVTADGGAQQVRQAILVGASAYIRKPFTAEQLRLRVGPLLDGEASSIAVNAG